jgi:hypothetical protein
VETNAAYHTMSPSPPCFWGSQGISYMAARMAGDMPASIIEPTARIAKYGCFVATFHNTIQ